jgi:hypothetical protein
VSTACSDCRAPIDESADPPGQRAPCPNCGSARRTVFVSARSSSTSRASATATIYRRWAEDWWHDLTRATSEADGSSRGARDAKRREIIAASAFIETYLYEFVHDRLWKGQSEPLTVIFPDDDRRDLTTRWNEAIRELHGRGLLAHRPDVGGPHGEEWKRLLAFRGWLLHANASRPNGQAANRVPLSLEEFDGLDVGWATAVVTERVRRLHTAAALDLPDWLPTEADPRD